RHHVPRTGPAARRADRARAARPRRAGTGAAHPAAPYNPETTAAQTRGVAPGAQFRPAIFATAEGSQALARLSSRLCLYSPVRRPGKLSPSSTPIVTIGQALWRLYLCRHKYRRTLATRCQWPHVKAKPIISGATMEGLVQILGGLALFLFGITLLNSGMEKLAGDQIQKWLDRATSNRVTSTIFGAAATGVLQSSGLLMVTMIGLINANLMTVEQSIAVMLGQEIGTTLTAQIVA